MIVNKYSKNGGGGSGSTVVWSQLLSAGTEIARISIDGAIKNVYAPEGGTGGVTSGQVQTMINTAIATESARTESTYLKEHQSLSGYATTATTAELNDFCESLAAGKQDNLTAGSGITLSGSTISCPNAVNAVQSTAITTIWKGTQAEYDALGTYDNNTFYIITAS